MTDRPPVSGEPHGLREAALAVIREWNAGARTGMGLTPMWGAMESLVAALAEAEASTGAALDVERLTEAMRAAYIIDGMTATSIAAEYARLAEQEGADRPPVSGEPPRRPCDPPTAHRYETVMTADGRFTTRIRCKRCGYEREG